MKRISKEKLLEMLGRKRSGEDIKFENLEIWNMDLTGMDFRGIDLGLNSFQNTILNKVDFSGGSVENALFDGCPMHGANFKGTNMKTASFRYCDMTECNIEDANLFGAVLEHANMEGIISNENTQWFHLHPPKEGAFLGYKKCVNNRLVQLLIPADAKRTSATLPSCRTNKAKVLTIKSFDYTQEFEEAWSLVDENFVYKKGEWVEVPNFNEDRWQDSTTGIHYWLTREEAKNY